MSSPSELQQRVCRLAVVDDDTLIREALRRMLPGHLRTEITARSVEEFLDRGRVEVDVVLLDLHLAGPSLLGGRGGPVLHGTRAVRILAERHHRILLYTNEARAYVLAACVAAGALGLAHKTEPLQDLVAAIDTVANGGAVLTPAVARVVRRVLERSRPQLTSREAEVIKLCAAGLAQKQIARLLGISIKTVEAHLRNVTTKFSEYLADHSIAQLAHEFGITEGDLVS